MFMTPGYYKYCSLNFFLLFVREAKRAKFVQCHAGQSRPRAMESDVVQWARSGIVTTTDIARQIFFDPPQSVRSAD